MTESDPYLQAAAWGCRGCGAIAYAAGADWLTDDLIIATFTQPHRSSCRGPRTWTALIDQDQLGLGAIRHAPTKNAAAAREHYRRTCCKGCGALTKARYCDTCRCAAATKQKQRCANRAGPGGTCGRHGDPAEHTSSSITENQNRVGR